LQESLAIARDIDRDDEKSRALTDIAVELRIQGLENEAASLLQESLAIARDISNDFYKSRALSNIAVELNKQGLLDESLAIACDIKNNIYKSRALKNIAVELSKLGLLNESLAIVRDIDRDSEQSRALTNIAVELRIQGLENEAASLMQESLAIARGISNDYEKSEALSAIALELNKQRCFVNAEEVGLKINLISVRQVTWMRQAKTRINIDGWQNALRQVEIFQSEEAKLFYLKGWADGISVIEMNTDCLQTVLPFFTKDINSIEILLQKYAINLICLNSSSKSLQEQLNKTLKLQWLLDITNKFPKSKMPLSKTPSNLSEWLHKIQDEDDRDQIELLAKQVAKGKITVAEFSEKIKTLNLLD
jgi:hypothetical protein